LSLAFLFERLRDSLRSTGCIEATVGGEALEVPDDDDIAVCKEKYGDHFQRLGRTTPNPLSRVRTELNVTEPNEEKNEQIDVAVLTEVIKKNITWNDGSMRFKSTDVDVAIELKYIKNQNRITLNSPSQDKLEDETVVAEDLDIDFTKNKIGTDIRELNSLSDTKSYLAIFSNYDYLYHGAHTDADGIPDKDTNGFDDRDSTLKSIFTAFEDEVRNRADDHVGVIYVHPTDYTWFTKSEME
jgi:hypothetical protein